MILEACVENINEASLAQSLGAHRIELCENLAVDGTTPSAGTIAVAKKLLDIPIMVLIRPRGGNFVYNQHEIDIMRHDIEVCKRIGVQGIVVGCLTSDKKIDLSTLEALIKIASPLEITFHKAIDETLDIVAEFKKLLQIGVDRLLTSGGKPTAIEGRDTINELVHLAGDKIKIIAAGNVEKANLPILQKQIRTNEFHGTKIVGSLTDLNT